MKYPHEYEIKSPVVGSKAFLIKCGKVILYCFASDDAGWEHVSVTLAAKHRCPTWEEMCFVKDIFWDKEECVMQLHPPRSEYVNLHNYCLHLWKPINQAALDSRGYWCNVTRPG